MPPIPTTLTGTVTPPTTTPSGTITDTTATRPTNTTIPNKIFDYMAMGKPVLASPAKPLAQIVHDTGCGVVFERNDAHAIATAIETLLADPAAAEAMGRRGRQAVETEYNWQSQRDKVVKVIDRLTGR